MKHILVIIILVGTICIPTMAQIRTFPLEKGYIVDVDSIYYDSTYVFPRATLPGKLSKKELKLKAKKEKLQSQTEIKKRPEGVLVPLADRKTFRDIGMGGYGVDHANAFFRGIIVEGADLSTFTQVEFPDGNRQSFYFKDKNHVYHLGKVLKGADPATFRYEGLYYAVDKNNIYAWEKALNIDPTEYMRLGDYILGSGKVYYGTKLLVNVNPDSFRLLEDGYATDGHKVIYYGKLTDADAPTFRKLHPVEKISCSSSDDCFYTDKYRLYLRGEPVDCSGLEGKTIDNKHLRIDLRLPEKDMKTISYSSNDTLGFRQLSLEKLPKEYKGRKNRHIRHALRSIVSSIENSSNNRYYPSKKTKYRLISDGVLLLGMKQTGRRGVWETRTSYLYFVSYDNQRVELVQELNEYWHIGKILFELLKYDYPDIEEADTITRIPPTFNGGVDELEKYLSDNTHYPFLAIDNGIRGRVVVAFTVNPNKSITDIEIINSIDRTVDLEAIRVVKLMNNMWQPGTVDGKETSVEVYLGINFRMNN